MTYRIGVDIGGTFTDFAVLEEGSGRVWAHKQLTTPADPAAAVLQGIPEVLGKARAAIGEVRAIVHGTTLVTNAVIERKGARVGMLVTAGFRDVLDIGRELRYDMFDLRQRFPEPLVARSLRSEIAERVRHDGSVETPVDLSGARAAIADLRARGMEALAVCFLHSYANPAHERAVLELARSEFPDLPASASADVWPQIRELERWTTTIVNAYAQPMVERYLGRLESGLQALGFRGRLYVMTSSGGTVEPALARRYPARLLESGPAAGALMAASLGRQLGAQDVLAFDMGGTTAKGCIIRKGEPLRRYELEVARLHEFKRGSGLTLKIPVIDMIEIGAGGGGIAGADVLGVLRVGPESAGADPGPACYARGGTRATLTDANVVLGLCDPERFLGGTMPLDVARARTAITKHVAQPLGLELERAAAGMHEVINEDVARAFRIHASERGVDYRRCTMIAFGGSGPAHAIRIARKLRIPRVVLARGAGVFSALGLLASPLAFEVARSGPLALQSLPADWWRAGLESLIAEAKGPLLAAGADPASIEVRCRLDMRYVGQGHEVEVPLPPDAASADLLALFEARYAELYGQTLPGTPVQIVTWKVEARGPDMLGSRAMRVQGELRQASARRAMRRAHIEGVGSIECKIYDRVALSPGATVEGPALLEEPESTCVIAPGDRARIDSHENLVVEIGQ